MKKTKRRRIQQLNRSRAERLGPHPRKRRKRVVMRLLPRRGPVRHSLRRRRR
jgi:hypothetical protein